MIGTTLANYRIEEKVGEGGMGVVYKATDLNLDRLVAIKVLSADISNDPGLLERFRAEAKAQANLNHANIASLYTLLTVDDRTCIVMEYLEGETLDQMLRRRGLIPWEEAVPLFRQALLGIGFAHRMGIIHRDIKPSNIMVNKYGVAKVMDFGIAKVLGGQRLTRTGTQVGTVAYMSPEQIRNRPVDIRSDIYCLGVTLYELLTAHLPFESDSEFEIMSSHVNTPPPPPTRHYPYIPHGIEQCVLKALEKDPDKRFQTVEEFGAALEHPGSIDEWLATHTPPSPPPVVHTGGTAPPESVSPFAATVLGATPPPPSTPAPGFQKTIVQPAQHTPPPPPMPPSAPPPGSAASKKLPIMLAAAAVLLLALGVGGYEIFKPKPVIHTSSNTGGGSSSLGVPMADPGSSSQPATASSTDASSDSTSQIDVSGLTKSTAPATDTNPPRAAATDTSTHEPQKATTSTRAARPRKTEQTDESQQQPQNQQQASVQQPPPIQPPRSVQNVPQQVPPSNQQPVQPQNSAPRNSGQQLRNGAAVFIVHHRHVGFSDRFNRMTSYCSGTLTVMSNGDIRYDCLQTQDSRCDHVTFSAADVKQARINHEGGLHIATRREGNWDFYGQAQQIEGALAAVTQVVANVR